MIQYASSPFRESRRVDVEGTARLLEAAAGVSHVVFVSILGIDRVQFYPYYGIKLETERVCLLPETIADDCEEAG